LWRAELSDCDLDERPLILPLELGSGVTLADLDLSLSTRSAVDAAIEATSGQKAAEPKTSASKLRSGGADVGEGSGFTRRGGPRRARRLMGAAFSSDIEEERGGLV
jgi:hypothetical protein